MAQSFWSSARQLLRKAVTIVASSLLQFSLARCADSSCSVYGAARNRTRPMAAPNSFLISLPEASNPWLVQQPQDAALLNSF